MAGAIHKKAFIPLDCSNTQQAIRAYSVAGQVPLLCHGNGAIWVFLAIAKYLAKQFPHAELWPANIDARAYARSVSCEMQTGFKALREHLPMDLRAQHIACLRKLWWEWWRTLTTSELIAGVSLVAKRLSCPTNSLLSTHFTPPLSDGFAPMGSSLPVR